MASPHRPSANRLLGIRLRLQPVSAAEHPLEPYGAGLTLPVRLLEILGWQVKDCKVAAEHPVTP